MTSLNFSNLSLYCRGKIEQVNLASQRIIPGVDQRIRLRALHPPCSSRLTEVFLLASDEVFDDVEGGFWGRPSLHLRDVESFCSCLVYVGV
jgi:hypothetical protein